jgi:hypothetical protein
MLSGIFSKSRDSLPSSQVKMADAPTLPAPDFAGAYTIERELGRGGMATVFLARDL